MMPSLTHRKHASEPINQLKSFVQKKTRWGLFARQKKNCWFCLNIRSKLKYASKKYIIVVFIYTKLTIQYEEEKKNEKKIRRTHTQRFAFCTRRAQANGIFFASVLYCKLIFIAQTYTHKTLIIYRFNWLRLWIYICIYIYRNAHIEVRTNTRRLNF